MKRETKSYPEEYKVEAVKLANEVGRTKAADELGIPKGTVYGWVRAAKLGQIDTGKGTQTPASAMTQAQEIQRLQSELKAEKKKVAELEEINAFLEEAASFFAASRQKQAKRRDSNSSHTRP